MQVGIDKARHGEFAGAINFGLASIAVMGADNPVADNGDIGFGDRAVDDVKQADITQHQIGLDFALTGKNAFAKMGLGKIAAHGDWSCILEILLPSNSFTISKGKACGAGMP